MGKASSVSGGRNLLRSGRLATGRAPLSDLSDEGRAPLPHLHHVLTIPDNPFPGVEVRSDRYVIIG
jgi:hypothetical protein